jgi:hypothetical protein
MLSMNVFKQDAFSAIQLSASIDRLDYVPTFLQTLPGIVEVEPVRTDVIWIEDRATGATILPFSPRGAPPHQTGGDIRKARSYPTLRYADASRITASELFNIRGWGSEVNIKTVQEEIARRQFKMKRNFQLTKEFHLFNLITKAQVIDPATSSVIQDWSTEWGQTIPTALNFDLSNATPAEGAVRKLCTQIRRSIQVNLKGLATPSKIVGLCGDTFWDNLTSHPEVVKTFLNWSAAADLRNGYGKEWSAFRYGEIEFVNYRGTDDGTTLGVGAKSCKFFPAGTGIFKWALSPGEKFEHLGTLGQDMYSNMVVDDDRDAWADVEAYSYPLPVCTQPAALHQATTP